MTDKESLLKFLDIHPILTITLSQMSIDKISLLGRSEIEIQINHELSSNRLHYDCVKKTYKDVRFCLVTTFPARRFVTRRRNSVLSVVWPQTENVESSKCIWRSNNYIHQSQMSEKRNNASVI